MDRRTAPVEPALPAVLVDSLAEFTHLVCTRTGLFAMTSASWVRVAHGKFFGATILGDRAVIFEQFDYYGAGTGRLLTLDLVSPRTFEGWATGFHSNCHQLDLVRGHLVVVDTRNQELVGVDRSGSLRTVARPLPFDGQSYAQGYVHFNSVYEADGLVYLLAHNGGVATGLPSRVVALDDDWQIVEQFLIPGRGCHNIVKLDDGSFLFCDSVGGNLIDRSGPLVHVDDIFLRGLSVHEDEIVVGASYYTERAGRHTVPGRVHFLDRSFRSRAVLELPGAPTEIRRLWGPDLAMSRRGAAA